MTEVTRVGRKSVRVLGALCGLALLVGCEDGAGLPFLQGTSDGATATEATSSTKLVERDVEAPEVFQVEESGLWDGRPSLGGVWVAHPDAVDPERVIIRNTTNGKFVIGALFRREREIPGPRIQASSDAAAALGMLAGAPVKLNVTALRRQATPVDEGTDDVATADVAEATAAPTVETQALDPIAGAAAAIDAAAPAAATTTPQARSASGPAASSSLEKPYIQIGIFSVEANARRTADQMRNAGIIPIVYEQSSNGKPFWRVVVGPAQTKSERSQLLKKVKNTGFSDAYPVTN